MATKTEKLNKLEEYLNQEWRDMGQNFIDRLLAKIEYEKLLKELEEDK